MDSFKKQSKSKIHIGNNNNTSNVPESIDKFSKNSNLFSNRKTRVPVKQNIQVKDQKIILGKSNLKKELIQLLSTENRITENKSNIFGNKKLVEYNDTICLKRHDNIVIKYKIPNNLVGKVLLLKIYSNMDNDIDVRIYIGEHLIPSSDKLLNRIWITVNYIDGLTHNLSQECVYIEPLVKSINIKGIYCDVVEDGKFVMDNVNLSCVYPNKLEMYKKKTDKSFNIGIIADVFTFENLSYLYNCTYIKPGHKIETGMFDILFCESVWGGIDESWRDEIFMFNKSKNKKIVNIIEQCKKHNIPTIFYAKEDPIFFDSFKECATMFDLVITTSKECVNKYKQIGCKKVMYTTFLINPIIHNPIKHGVIDRIAFPGSYYQFLENRVNVMDSILNANSGNNKIDVYDRQHVHNKVTDQIQKMSTNKDKCKFPSKYKLNIFPSLMYSQIIDHVYKKYKYILNINSISDSETMFSRRVMEVAGCGTNIISNDSVGMKNIFGDNMVYLNKNNGYKIMDHINSMPNINIKLYEKVHLNYTYKHLFKKILRIFNKDNNLDQSICIISDQNILVESKIKTAYTVLYNDDENLYSKFEWIIKLKKNNYYYDSLFIRKLLLPVEYVDTNISISKNNNDIFKFSVNNVDAETCVLNCKNNGQNKNFAINNIYNLLRQNPFNFVLHNKNMNYSMDDSNIPIIMCTYNRIEKLSDTLQNLDKQTYSKFHLFIWNNNKQKHNEVQNIITDSSVKYNISVHHSVENIGGYGRFIMAKYLTEKIGCPYVIFIDDDQILGNRVIEELYNKKKSKTSFHWSGRKFTKDKGYWDSWSNIFSHDKQKYDQMDYGGTGTMIIDSAIFRDDSFFYINKKYLFIEDLWLSYYSKKYHDYKIFNLNNLDVKGINDGKDQSINVNMKKLKDEFLGQLRTYGEWNI